MLFFKTGLRAVSVAVLAVMSGACASADDEELYGYESSYTIPQPDMVPQTPDDRPGRTVEEMLRPDLHGVTVNAGTYQAPAESDKMYEHNGRFGSKEKIALRKGLNAPETGIVYGAQKRREAEIVRPLAVDKVQKDELLAKSEEELLAEIIAPKTTKIEMIEVVTAENGGRGEAVENKESVLMIPVQPATTALPEPAEEKAEPEQKSAEAKPVVSEKTELLVAAPAPAPAKKPAVTLNAPKVEKPAEKPRLKLVAPERKFKLDVPEKVPVLTPPSESKPVLTPPAGAESESSVEIFIEE